MFTFRLQPLREVTLRPIVKGLLGGNVQQRYFLRPGQSFAEATLLVNKGGCYFLDIWTPQVHKSPPPPQMSFQPLTQLYFYILEIHNIEDWDLTSFFDYEN
jgi:hypothetical protein